MQNNVIIKNVPLKTLKIFTNDSGLTRHKNEHSHQNNEEKCFEFTRLKMLKCDFKLFYYLYAPEFSSFRSEYRKRQKHMLKV